MNKSFLWLIGLLFSFAFLSVSCDETEGELDPYANWEERNKLYIDSIASVARANQGNEVGQWKIFLSYKLNESNPGDLGSGSLGQGGLGQGNLGQVDLNKVENHIYCKILKKGEGKKSPLFKDEVDTHYRGKLINNYQFDSSYKGDKLEEEFSTPTRFGVGQVITGWTTALQEMVEGDYWEVYIPHKLAYGEQSNPGIPSKSTLIFDVKLVKIYPQQGIESKSADEPLN